MLYTVSQFLIKTKNSYNERCIPTSGVIECIEIFKLGLEKLCIKSLDRIDIYYVYGSILHVCMYVHW